MKYIKNILSRVIASRWTYPLALLFIGIIAYGLMLPRLGFYWDDWEGVYLYHLHNPGLGFHYYAERPFSALIFQGLFPFIRMTPAVMEAVSLLFRWGGILFIYQTLNLIWPERKPIHQWAGALLIVFPGFSEQEVSVAFTPHLGTFLIFSCSLFLTALALRDKRRFWLWMPLSVVTGIAQIFMMEYFVVLEVLRPLMIWFILRDEQETVKRTVVRTFLTWLPFLVGLGAFLWWRLVYLPSTLVGGDPNNPSLLAAFLHSPVTSLLSLIQKIIGDLRYLIVDSWINAFFNPNLVDLLSKILWAGWFIGILVAVLFSLYNRAAAERNPTGLSRSFLKPVLFGMIAFLAGGIPVWVTDRQVSVGKWSDRFSLSTMLGVVILVVSVVDWLFRTKKQKQWLMIALLGFSISFQLWNTNSYRLDWDLQRNIYWQLAWRVPSLKPGTTVIGKGTFTGKSSYYDATYIMSLLFDQNPKADPAYGYIDVFHIFPDEAGNYKGGQPISISTRSGQFSGNSSQAIGMYFTQSEGCVRILDQVYQADPVLANDMNSLDRLNRLIALSNVNLIVNSSQPTRPDTAIFGSEPAHGWCYYFEKADLARQMKDWQTVLELGSQAQSQGLRPAMGVEYLPFIEAYAQTGDWSKAYELSTTALAITKDLGPNLCMNWARFGGINEGTERDKFLAQAKSDFCGEARK